jgi:hypothetical protein
VQVPRAKMPVSAPETTQASSLGRCNGTLRSSSASSSGTCAGGATTSATSITTRFARVCVAFIFGAALVWRGREGRARGSPGGQGSLLKLLA